MKGVLPRHGPSGMLTWNPIMRKQNTSTAHTVQQAKIQRTRPVPVPFPSPPCRMHPIWQH